MIEVFAELNLDSKKSGSIEAESLLIKKRAGVDPEDFEDKDIQQILGVFDEFKKGLYGSEYDSE